MRVIISIRKPNKMMDLTKSEKSLPSISVFCFMQIKQQTQKSQIRTCILGLSCN